MRHTYYNTGMTIETYPLGQLQTNCYVVHDPDSGDCVVIDPADAAEWISQKLIEKHVTSLTIVATHGHFDHNLAAGELQLIMSSIDKSTPTIPYYIHEKDSFLLKQMNTSARHWLGLSQDHILPEKISFITKAGELRFGTISFRIIETPGHTPGSISLLLKSQLSDVKGQMLFSGDTLFQQGIGRYDFSYSDSRALFRSLAQLGKLDPQTIVYPGHGSRTTIKDELDTIAQYTQVLS